MKEFVIVCIYCKKIIGCYQNEHKKSCDMICFHEKRECPKTNNISHGVCDKCYWEQENVS